jgi:diguanylate cyclase (GGDEF)-like protein
MAVVLVALIGVAAIAVIFAVVAQRRATRARRRLERAQSIDAMTGLPNRFAAERSITTRRDRHPDVGSGAYFLVSLDRFAGINETYGPEVGDALLLAVSTQIQRALRRDETVARYAGPQFLVMAPGVADADGCRRRAAELHDAVQVPYRIGTDQIRIDVAVGAKVDDDPRQSPAEILADAELALDDASDSRAADPQAAEGSGARGRVTVYDSALRAGRAPVNSERRLRQAIEDNEFELAYRPIVDLADGRVAGVEAHLRWHDPDRGLLEAAAFGDRLEETGLIVSLGWWQIGEACRQSRLWSERFPHAELFILLHLSPRQLAQTDLASRVAGMVGDAGVEHGRLCLEIPEAASGAEVDRSWTALRPLKEAGVALGLDDFGVGYSSLRYLRRFQLDFLKIHRSFVSELGTSNANEAIVEQVVNLAHALEIATIADGVDSIAQDTMVRSMRCEYATGELYGGVMTTEAIDELVGGGTVRSRPTSF